MTKESFSISRVFKLFISALKGKETEFTTGSINRAIVLLSIPIIAEMTGEALFALIDMIFVSRVSVNAVATIGLTEAPLMIIFSLAIGLSMAATAIVARRVGEKEYERAANAAFQAIIIAIVIGITLGIFGYQYSAEILELMGGDSSLIEEGVGYTQVMYGANISIVLIFLINGIFRGAGNASIAMKSLLLANGLNIILDPIFIFGWGIIPAYGVEGAAIATTIGRSCGVVYQIFYLFNGKSLIKITVANFIIKWKTIKEIIVISAGGIGQFLVETLSWLFLVRIVSEFGKEAMAGYQISFRVIYFTLLPSWGMANAAATLVGQNLGALKPERAEKSVWVTAKWNAIFLVFITVLFSLFSTEVLSIFDQPKSVIDIGSDALKIICVGYVFFAYGMVLGQGFNGAGDTKTPMYISIVVFWLIQIPLSYFLSFTMGWETNGVFFCIAFCHSLYALVAMVIFKRGKWKTVKV
ncbi:putative efflux protein, MATE family [Ekhidna lutea]|uniref:Multidrug-efflux transporter n=1 Tax=Ekhidna lutea TaxID=447679 RepID=A0A239HGY4_EKHLU|nr:MATE family efflux transporter [Ekhidna lutea]SNS80572.1 putative efflux protein, MATE family [Ekhidna lutea]